VTGYSTLRLRSASRSLDASALPVLGAGRADRLRDRARLRADPARRAHLRRRRPVIFAGLILFDFQRLRQRKDIRTAPLLAASIFLDILNVFLLFLSIFGNNE
jgi:hypothetical protein